MVRTNTFSTPRSGSEPASPDNSAGASGSKTRSVPGVPGVSVNSGAGYQVSRTDPSAAMVARPSATAPLTVYTLA
ncbi:Uncharacterised protein [Mycobacteroides abscessus subsp. abscessus]|nr:Uncharacterised protein [Mycobacteroides abscessus subsp. abscessus]